MYLASYFNYYRVGRFIFALTLLLSFQITGLLSANPGLRNVFIIYSVVAFVRLLVSAIKTNPFDFLLDIVFVSSMVYTSISAYSYLTVLYLFPVFFASVLIQRRRIFIFPLVSILLYGAVYYANGLLSERESILNISLHLLAFSLIALAGDYLKIRIERQEQHIKRLEEEKIRMEGYERLFRVSADLAHELRNPLASITAAVQFLKEGRNDREFIEMLSTETGRLNSLVNDFLLFSRPADAPREEVALSGLLATVAGYYQSEKKIELALSSEARIVANRMFMEVALNNIIKNALEAARSTVRLTLGHTGEGSAIQIEDDGPGIPGELRDKIFEPFVTTKARGTGLGLAIAYRMITAYGGTVAVAASDLGGAKFTVAFPDKERIKGE